MKLLTPCLGVCAALAALAATPAAARDAASTTLIGPDNQRVGEATLTNTPTGVMIDLKIDRLPAGAHALHIADSGTCDAPSFNQVGHILSVTPETPHGAMDPNGPEAGDLPNIHVPDTGKLEVEVWARSVTLNDGQPNSLYDPHGSSLLIHQNPDDYRTQPDGNSGPVIACGRIGDTRVSSATSRGSVQGAAKNTQ